VNASHRGENARQDDADQLLARLYDPTEGRILLDGVDLREYDIYSVRRAIGVIFQDFVKYDLRFDENVGVGEIDKVRSYLDAPGAKEPENGPDVAKKGNGEVPGAIVSASEKSLASSLLPKFSKGQADAGRRLMKAELSRRVAKDRARSSLRDAQVLTWMSRRHR
jgi:ATP-binding cassette subfamily B protein